MADMVAIWEYRPGLGWWIHRSGYHPQVAEETVKALNEGLQQWRKDQGVYYKVFPYGVVPDEVDSPK